MYNNKYFMTMTIPTRMRENFSNSELDRLENTRLEFNDRFQVMPSANTRNRKYIDKITTNNKGEISFVLETQYPLNDPRRAGNALRLFSILASQNGLNLYVSNHRLMRAA